MSPRRYVLAIGKDARFALEAASAQVLARTGEAVLAETDAETATELGRAGSGFVHVYQSEAAGRAALSLFERTPR